MAAGFTTIAIKDATGTTKQLAVYADAGGTLYPAPTGTDALGDILGLAANPIVVLLSASSAIAGKFGIDQTTLGTTNRVYMNTASLIVASGNTVTRPNDTTAYSSGDFIGNSTTAASCTLANSGFTVASARANDIPGRLIKCILQISGTVAANAVFRVHIFNSNPLSSAPANGDNGVFNMSSAAGYLGRFDVTVNQVFGNGCVGFGTPTEGNYVDFTPATGTQNLFAVLEARASFTPIAQEVFTLTLITE